MSDRKHMHRVRAICSATPVFQFTKLCGCFRQKEHIFVFIYEVNNDYREWTHSTGVSARKQSDQILK